VRRPAKGKAPRFFLLDTIMAFPATQIRRGMVLVFEGDPCRVIEFRHHTPGNLRAMVQAKLKNLRSGSNFEHRFRAADTVEKGVDGDARPGVSVPGRDTYHFMNTENYDQIEMDSETLGDYAQWMQPGMKIQAEYYNGRPIGIDLPNSMVFEIVDTSVVMKTATKTASTEAGEARERSDDQRSGVRENGRESPR
jgi:elongation factor P